MDISDILWELAKDSTIQVSLLAAELAAKFAADKGSVRKQGRILSDLASRLFLVHNILKRPSPSQQIIIWGRLEKLLAELERVCTWSNNDAVQACWSGGLSSRFPTLNAIVDYPATVEKIVQHGLAAFVSEHPKLLKDYLRNLESFSKPRHKDFEGVTSAPEESVRRAINPFKTPDEYPAHVNQSLYAILHRHSPCTCPGPENREGTFKRHWGRLRLKGRFQTSNNHILFDLLFSTTPIPRGEVRWQQLELHVSRKKLGTKGVKILEEAKEFPTKPSIEEERAQVVETGEFCRLLGRPLGDVRICLKVKAGELLQLYDGKPIDQHIIPAPSISLSEALEVHLLSTKMKIVLAYILTQSIWQFYNSDWMKTEWTSDLIHFMLERSPNDQVATKKPNIYACNPYFALQFDGSNESFTEHCASRSILHRYPRVLALGILLVEIGQEANGTRTTSQVQSLEEKINNDWTMGQIALRNKSWPYFDFLPGGTVVQTYKTVVTACFDREIFNNVAVPLRDSDAKQGIEERRAILYERIVYPLETLLTDMNWTHALENIEPVDLTRPPAQPTGAQSPESLQLRLSNTTTDSTNRESERWLETIRCSSLNEQIVSNFRNNASPQPVIPRIKAAILDTGYDEEAEFFNHVRRKSIKGWKDWVKSSPYPQDQDGHGTHVLSLFMKIAPAVDVFVARVARDENDLQSASDNVAKAVAWAANECNVDIISMSFGFPEEVPVISNAILQAVRNRNSSILFFAAAANSGANQKEMFPANHNYVISMRGTNFQGVFQGFNPPPDCDGEAVYGTLGKEVPSAWLSTYDGEKCQSGTSVATPIAAGIAAMILGYASFSFADCIASKPMYKSFRKLWTKRGMLFMFNMMSVPVQEKCRFLSPLEFMRKSDEERQAMIIVAAGRV